MRQTDPFLNSVVSGLIMTVVLWTLKKLGLFGKDKS
jgi:hypothetical protein